MTEPYRLGCIPSPPDERDYPISALYEALGAVPSVALPIAFSTTPEPPIGNQGDTPMCVAYTAAGVKQYQDYGDTTVPKWWNFDESRLFYAIGGGADGAMLRSAMDYLVHTGYPVAGASGLARDHKIAAYYRVPVTVADLKQALVAFGDVALGTKWQNSWFSPVNGILPTPDYEAGGHAIRLRGWNDQKGFLLANSWGTEWGVSGECWLPYKYLSRVFEAWKAVDEEVKPAPPVLFRLHVLKGTTLAFYTLDSAGRIVRPTTTVVWTRADTSWACTKPVAREAYTGKLVTTVKILSSAYAGKTTRVFPPGTFVT